MSMTVNCWVYVIESLFACFSWAELQQKSYLIRFCCCYWTSTHYSLTFFMWLFRWTDHFKTILRHALKSWLLLLQWRCLAHREILNGSQETYTELENTVQHLPWALAGGEKPRGPNQRQEQAFPFIITEATTKDTSKGPRAVQHLPSPTKGVVTSLLINWVSPVSGTGHREMSICVTELSPPLWIRAAGPALHLNCWWKIWEYS